MFKNPCTMGLGNASSWHGLAWFYQGLVTWCNLLVKAMLYSFWFVGACVHLANYLINNCHRLALLYTKMNFSRSPTLLLFRASQANFALHTMLYWISMNLVCHWVIGLSRSNSFCFLLVVFVSTRCKFIISQTSPTVKRLDQREIEWSVPCRNS